MSAEELRKINIKINFLKRRGKHLKLAAIRAYKKCLFYRQGWLFAKNKLKKRVVWSDVGTSNFWEKDVPTFKGEKFKNAFRVSRPTFRLLCEHLQILRKKDTTWRSAIPLAKRIAIALYALGSSAEYRTIASLFRVGRTTVGEIVLDFCFAVWDTFQKKLLNVYPPNQEKVEEIVKGFETLGFPQCFGAIDGCHIEIRPPQHEAAEYYNFKGWHSIVLFASVDYRYRFTYVNVGITGRSNDSTIFEISSLKMQHFENSIFKKNCRDIEGVNVPVLLIGDSAFKLTKYVMKPFPFSINQSSEQKKFNKELSKCRRVVENAFGHLKARFRRIGKGLEVNIDNASMVVKACCILHNLCNESNDKINKKWIEELNEVEKQSGRKQPDRVSTARTESGVEVRNAIMKHFERCRVTDDNVRADDDANGDASRSGDDGTARDVEGRDVEGIGCSGVGDNDVIPQGDVGRDAEIDEIFNNDVADRGATVFVNADEEPVIVMDIDDAPESSSTAQGVYLADIDEQYSL